MAWGRPPPADSVVAIRRVEALETALEREKLIFWPLLTALNMAMGQELGELEETVPGVQLDILLVSWVSMPVYYLKSKMGFF